MIAIKAALIVAALLFGALAPRPPIATRYLQGQRVGDSIIVKEQGRSRICRVTRVNNNVITCKLELVRDRK